MSEKVILITGGSRGIGAATVLLAAQQGYSVCFTYHVQKKLAEDLVSKLSVTHSRVEAVQADIKNEKDVVKVFELIDKKFGRLDALVNNAGVLRKKLFLDTDASELQSLFGINVIGSFLCAREAVKRMAISKGGRGGGIVNVSSIASRLGSPFEYIDYAASKGAIDAFTLGLAKEMAEEKIRVNAVRPGIINTEIHAHGGEPGRIARIAPTIPMHRAGEPEEVAKTILWLLSDDASYLTGSLIDVSGGR